MMRELEGRPNLHANIAWLVKKTLQPPSSIDAASSQGPDLVGSDQAMNEGYEPRLVERCGGAEGACGRADTS